MISARKRISITTCSQYSSWNTVPMAVAVNTTARKARAMDGIETLFCDAIEHMPLGVSKSTVQVESAEVPRSKSD